MSRNLPNSSRKSNDYLRGCLQDFLYSTVILSTHSEPQYWDGIWRIPINSGLGRLHVTTLFWPRKNLNERQILFGDCETRQIPSLLSLPSNCCVEDPTFPAPSPVAESARGSISFVPIQTRGHIKRVSVEHLGAIRPVRSSN